jgi:RNA recognition motif-containing protein
MKRLFVGNLDFHPTEDELRQLFAAHGPVDRVDIVKDYSGHPRGFAFVEMANADDGDKAITALDGTQFSGRILTVSEARPRPQRVSGGGERRRTGGRW